MAGSYPGTWWTDDDMASWAQPAFSLGDIRQAGKIFISKKATAAERDAALVVINNWRSSHSFPLNSTQLTLRSRVRRVSPVAIVAQRLKRLSAIEKKLRRHGKYVTLDEMQDIGGCRAITTSVKHVHDIVRQYKTPNRSMSQFVREYDYIATPKSDGYRSYHLIYRYKAKWEDQVCYDGMVTEIQLRSRLQHMWATAVETVDFLTDQALKSNVGRAEWKRFFRVMGSYMALKENSPLVPGTPSTEQGIVSELAELSDSLKPSLLLGTVAEMTGARTGERHYLLQLDPVLKRVHVRGFKDLKAAASAYEVAEQQAGLQAVLVRADDFADLKKAYPSYFLDSAAFVGVLEDAIAKAR